MSNITTLNQEEIDIIYLIDFKYEDICLILDSPINLNNLIYKFKLFFQNTEIDFDKIEVLY